jgi:hypothetical protein
VETGGSRVFQTFSSVISLSYHIGESLVTEWMLSHFSDVSTPAAGNRNKPLILVPLFGAIFRWNAALDEEGKGTLKDGKELDDR